MNFCILKKHAEHVGMYNNDIKSIGPCLCTYVTKSYFTELSDKLSRVIYNEKLNILVAECMNEIKRSLNLAAKYENILAWHDAND